MVSARDDWYILGMDSESNLISRLRGFTSFDSRLHGPAHWSRVRRFGFLLADQQQLNERQTRCVEVFSWTHDLARVDDGGGNQHAIDGAVHCFAVMEAVFPDLDDLQQQLVSTAIRFHSDGLTADEAYFQGLLDIDGWSEDAVIEAVGAAWDADRLDLLRLGIEPLRRFMSTSGWRDVLPYASQLHTRR